MQTTDELGVTAAPTRLDDEGGHPGQIKLLMADIASPKWNWIGYSGRSSTSARHSRRRSPPERFGTPWLP